MARGRTSTTNTKQERGRVKNGTNGASLGFEAQLFLAADKLRKNLEPSDLANPLFNVSDWSGERLLKDARISRSFREKLPE